MASGLMINKCLFFFYKDRKVFDYCICHIIVSYKSHFWLTFSAYALRDQTKAFTEFSFFYRNRGRRLFFCHAALVENQQKMHSHGEFTSPSS